MAAALSRKLLACRFYSLRADAINHAEYPTGLTGVDSSAYCRFRKNRDLSDLRLERPANFLATESQ